jgi:hypothetical protein
MRGSKGVVVTWMPSRRWLVTAKRACPRQTPTVCYTECYRGGRIVEAHEKVAGLVTVISMLRAWALSLRESQELIRQIRSQINAW